MGTKKKDSFYFDNFIACAEYSCQAAKLLEKGMKDFDPKKINEMIDEMHEVEHGGDDKTHELLHVLAKAFITPIEREDIMDLSQNIDEVTDNIEDVLLRLYCNNIQSIRPDALELVAIVIKCCDEIKNMLAELPNFKRSKKLREHIININTLEEEADQLFISSMRNLHTESSDPEDPFTPEVFDKHTKI